MKYTIIEDCSPYYIRFTHDGLSDIIDYCKENVPDISSNPKTFIHHQLPLDRANRLLSLLPMDKQIPLKKHRVSLFITKAGRYYRAHKDGSNTHFSINYAVQVLDDKCVTSWYSDSDLCQYDIDTLGGYSRECQDFVKQNHIPLKSMIAQPNECVLFNTEIFHDFDNSQSDSTRIMLTLRITESLQGVTYFEDARKILFGF